MSEFDVVISGYGPTGATAANLLGQRGLRVLVVEPALDVYDIPRAVHFDGEVMRIFQALGLSEPIRSVSGTASHLAFVNARGLTLQSVDVGAERQRHGWPVGNFFNQPLLERHLRAGVARFEDVELRLGWRLEELRQDADGVEARIAPADPRGGGSVTVRSAFLLGCDGASSPTRKAAGIDLEDLGCHEPWLVCDLILEDDVEIRRRALQICDPRRPTTLVPCEGRHLRWEFMLRPGDDPAHLEDERTARAMMAPHLHHVAPGLTPDRGKLVRSKVYTFHSLVAREFRAGRVFLLGDAAHQTPPFLGQGMCAGIRDAFNLCWKLAGVLEGRLRPELLESYSSERRPHSRRVVREAVRAGSIIQTTHRGRAWVRDAWLLLQRLVPGLGSPPRWSPRWPLGPGLFGPETPPDRDSAHGHPVDQPWLETVSGERVRLDGLLGDGFALLGLGVDPATLLDDAGLAAARALGARCLHVGSADDSGAPLRDVDGGLAAWSAPFGPVRVVAVRPDRQVFDAWSAPPDDPRPEALSARVSAGLVDLAVRALVAPAGPA